MYTAFVVKLWVSKEVKPVKLSLLCVVRLFWFCYFHRFRHSERGIKSLRLEAKFIKILHWSALIPVLLTDLTFSAFAWTDLSDLDDPLDWAFVTWVWPHYGHTRTDGSGQRRQCGRHHNCVALYYETGASGNAFLRKEKFRAPFSRQEKTLKVLKETVSWVDLSLLLSIINCFQRPQYPCECIRSIKTWNINGFCAPRYGRRLKWLKWSRYLMKVDYCHYWRQFKDR